MAEYIDRAAMLLFLHQVYDGMFARSADFYNGFTTAIGYIENFPTVNVNPTTHAHWEEKEDLSEFIEKESRHE